MIKTLDALNMMFPSSQFTYEIPNIMTAETRITGSVHAEGQEDLVVLADLHQARTQQDCVHLQMEECPFQTLGLFLFWSWVSTALNLCEVNIFQGLKSVEISMATKTD